MTDSKFLTFEIKNNIYAINASLVQSIRNRKNICKIPGQPDLAAGMIQYRTALVPVLNAAKILNSQLPDQSLAQIMIVKGVNGDVGILIPRVSDMISIKSSGGPEIQNSSMSQGDCFEGIVVSGKHVQDKISDDLIRILDLNKIQRMISDVASETSKNSKHTDLKSHIKVHSGEKAKESDYLCFNSNGLDYCLLLNGIDFVEKIPPDVNLNFRQDQHADLLSIRGDIVRIVCPESAEFVADRTEKNAGKLVIVLVNGGEKVAVLCDEINGVVKLKDHQISALNQSRLKVSQKSSDRYCQFELGVKKIMSKILEKSDLFANMESGAMTKDIKDDKKARNQVAGKDKSIELIVFKVHDKRLAVSLKFVDEVIRVKTILDIPGGPDYVSGIMSHRGSMIPVIDLGLRIELGLLNQTKASRIVLIRFKQQVVGFMVDSVEKIYKISASSVKDPPSVLSEGQSVYIDKIVEQGDNIRPLPILNIEYIATNISELSDHQELEKVG